MDAVTEVEKLNAAQQLTTATISSSTVNMMSNEEDWCFQCQELGHIAWHCPHIICHECDEFGHIIMDCPHRIPLQGHWHHTTRHMEITTTDLALETTRKTEKEETSPDHSLDTANMTAPAAVTCTEATPNHNNGTGTVTIEAAQMTPLSTPRTQPQVLPWHTTLQIIHTPQLIRLPFSGSQ